jgi:hypothetical protein
MDNVYLWAGVLIYSELVVFLYFGSVFFFNRITREKK